MRFIRLFPFALLAFSLCGCYPEERFWWSPTGDRAIVAVKNRLHVVTADGELGEVIPGLSLEGALVKTVNWLPDGTGFVCQRVRRIATWDEVRTLIPAEEATAVEALMPAVLPLLEAAAKVSKGADSPEALAKMLALPEKHRFHAALQRTWQEKTAIVEGLLGSLPKGNEIIASMRKEDSGYDVGELALFKLGGKPGDKPTPLSCGLLAAAVMPKVSPKHPYVACLKLDEHEESATLELLSLDGGPGMTVARHVAGAFDWMPDGRTLVFMAPLGGDGEKLQSIHRLTVVQKNGAMMKPAHEPQPDGSHKTITGPDRLTEPMTLVTAIMLNRPSLQSLQDGRVLFASQPATLPATGTGPTLEPRLYLIAADGKSVIAVPTAPGDLPTNLGYFVVSPDGKHIAVVESETDALAVVETDSGKTQIISPPHPHWQCETIPAWKSATELSFAALDPGTKTPKWMLWSVTGDIRNISSKWHATATADWLKNKEPK